MFETKKPTNKLKNICAQLGKPYTIKVIDYENVIYHTVGNYEFEVSGLDNNEKLINATIYVHTLSPRERIEVIKDIGSVSRLGDKLVEVIHKYTR